MGQMMKWTYSMEQCGTKNDKYRSETKGSKLSMKASGYK